MTDREKLKRRMARSQYYYDHAKWLSCEPPWWAFRRRKKWKAAESRWPG